MNKINPDDILAYLANSAFGSLLKRGTIQQGRPAREYLLSDAFQEWFLSGLRQCDRHAYPFLWHVSQSDSCRRCNSK